MQGAIIFRGEESNGGKSHHLSIQEAMGDAIIKTKELGYTKMLIICNSKRLVQICSQMSKPTWLEQTLILDLNQLQQQGLINHLFVPKEVISDILPLAYMTTCFSVHHCRLNPNLSQSQWPFVCTNSFINECLFGTKYICVYIYIYIYLLYHDHLDAKGLQDKLFPQQLCLVKIRLMGKELNVLWMRLRRQMVDKKPSSYRL